MATEILWTWLKAKKTTVETAVQVIPSTGAAPGTDVSESGRQSIDILNNGSQILYIGYSVLEVGKGYPLATGASKQFDAADGCVIYGRTSTGTTDVRTLEAV